MPKRDTAHKLDHRARDLVLQLLAEYAKPAEVIQAVQERHGVTICRGLVYWYKHNHRARIEELRGKLDAARLPISSAWWRMRERQKLLDIATTGPDLDLSTARGILTDAARELGQLRPEETTTRIGNVTIHLLQQVLALPSAVLDEYLETGNLSPSSYLMDIPQEATQEEPEPAGPPSVDGAGSS